MIYNKAITQKLYSYFKVRWGMEDYHKGWLRGDCPDCGKKNKWGVQLFTNRSNCFVCGYAEKPVYAVMKIEGHQTLSETWAMLKAFEGVSYDMPDLERFEKKALKGNKIETQIALPDGFKNIILGNDTIGKMARKYLKGRGFRVEDLALRGIGYCEGNNEYFGYIIFPFIMKGQLTYFQARKFFGNGPKFNNPEVEKFNIGKTQLIYNLDALWVYKRIWLVESITNSLTLGPNAIAIMGKDISRYQLSVIIKSPVEEIIICLDHDAIGQAILLGLKLIPYKRVKLILMPDDRDVNARGKKEMMVLKKESEWVSHGKLLKLKNEYAT